ncbi:TPA: relaxase/mobilization nuclease domain-containing protein [Campylobacter lari]|nr:relaxase/mobilization nuclease domain-containing protein [Campylobacter lari]
MIIKFFKNKKGENGGLPSVDYLLNAQRVKNGTAKILKGDENTTREIIKSLNFKHKVCAGCLSFEEQNIDENTKKEIMESFEEMLLTPAMQGRLNILWVEHTDKNRLELNFVIPRIDLETQKSFSPYFHKSDFKRVDLWGDFVNLSYGFSNPKDPTKEQNIKNINHHAKTFKDHKELDKHFKELILENLIESRADLINYIETELKDIVEITRKGENYLSLKLPNDKKAVRYKGEIYTNGNYADTLRKENAEKQRNYRELNQRRNTESITEIRAKLNKLIEFKTGYYRNKYKSNIEENAREHRRTSNDKHNEVNSNLANTNNNHQHSNLLHSNTTENVTKRMDFRQRNANHTDKGHQEHRRHESREHSSNTQQGISDEHHREYINAITERKRRANARARNTYEREQRASTRKRNTYERKSDIVARVKNYNERKRNAFNKNNELRKRSDEFANSNGRKIRIRIENSKRLRKRANKLNIKRFIASFNKLQPRFKEAERQQQIRERVKGIIATIQDIARSIKLNPKTIEKIFIKNQKEEEKRLKAFQKKQEEQKKQAKRDFGFYR